MNREDDQQLWDLLGGAKPLPVSPFFARNVLRTIRQRPAGFRRLSGWFALNRLVPAATIAMAIMVTLFVVNGPVKTEMALTNDSDPVARIDPQDYDVVADLDELIASDENALWDDNSSL